MGARLCCSRVTGRFQMASADFLSHLDTQYAYLCYATNRSSNPMQILATAGVCAPSTKDCTPQFKSGFEIEDGPYLRKRLDSLT